MPGARERLPELDALRGLAALTVVFYHTLLTLQLSDSTIHRLLNALPSHPMFAGRLAVIFFFVLSGMVLTRGLMTVNSVRPAVDFARFAGQRLVRLCVPTAVVLVMSAGLYYWLWNGPWPGSALYGGWRLPPMPDQLFRQALLIGAGPDFYLDPVLWSLVIELRLSVILPLLVAVPAFRGPDGSVILVLLGLFVFGIAVAGQTSIENTILLGQTMLDSVRATAYFALPFLTGAAISLGGWHTWKPGVEQGRIALAAALLLLCSDNDIAAVIASVLLILLSRHAGWYRDFLRLPALLLLGRISFSLYLVHMPVLFAVQHGLHLVLAEAWLEPLTIVASLATAWIIYVVAERPARMLSHRLGPMRPNRDVAARDVPVDQRLQRQTRQRPRCRPRPGRGSWSTGFLAPVIGYARRPEPVPGDADGPELS